MLCIPHVDGQRRFASCPSREHDRNLPEMQVFHSKFRSCSRDAEQLQKIKKSTCILSRLVLYLTSRLTRPVGQGVKTPPSHGGNTGSIPVLAVNETLRRFPGGFCFMSAYIRNAKRSERTDFVTVMPEKGVSIKCPGKTIHTMPPAFRFSRD